MDCETRTLCGVRPLLVVCTYVPLGECFYPSGPCRHGLEAKRQHNNGVSNCVGTSQYAAHLEENNG